MTISLTLTSATTQAAAPFAVGHIFKQGDIPGGSSIAASIANFQATIKNAWPDGSARFAILAGRAALTANTPLALTLSPGAAASGTALTTADLIATGIAASIDAGSFGAASWATTDWNAPFVPWVSGPQMSSWIYRKPIGSDPHLVGWLEVRLFAGGAVEVLPWVENGFIRVAAPTSKNAVFSFTLGGTSRFSERIGIDIPLTSFSGAQFFTKSTTLGAGPVRVGVGSLEGSATFVSRDSATQIATYTVTWDGATPSTATSIKMLGTPHHTRTVLISGAMLSHWLGTDPGVIPSHDKTYFKSTALVPNYSAVVSPSSTLVTSLPATYTPNQQGGYSDIMGDTGYQSTIGLLPQWDALHLTCAAALVWSALQRNAYSAGRFPIHFRDENTNRPLRFDQYQHLSVNASTTNDYPPAPTGPEVSGGWDIPHHPSVGAYAYMLTGRWYHMETLLFSATYNFLYQVDDQRQFSTGIFLPTSGACTTRGAAWALRTLAQAATFVPDADTALRTNLIASLEANISFHDGRKVNPFGFIQPYDAYGTFSDGMLQEAPWQQHFFTASIGYILAMKPPISSAVTTKLAALFEWKAKQPVGMLGGLTATDWLYRDATPYVMTIAFEDFPDWAGGTGPWPASWGAMYTAVYGTANPGVDGPLRGGNFPNATSYWGNLHPSIAYSVQHAASGATTAYARMTTASNYADLVADFPNAPEWSVTPLSVSGAVMTTPGPSIRVDTLPLYTAGFIVTSQPGIGVPGSQIAGVVTGADGTTPIYDAKLAAGGGFNPLSEYRVQPGAGAHGVLFVSDIDLSEIYTGDGTYDPITTTTVEDGAVIATTAQNFGTVPSTVTSVTVSPTTANGSTTFAATVAGTGSPSPAVTWTRSGTAGSINANTGVFTAPAQTTSAQTITITATSVQDNTKSGTATVTIAAAASTVTGVTLTPASLTITGAAQQQFSASVAGTNNPSQNIVWSKSGNGTLSSSGLFTAPAATTSTQITTITATSAQDGSKAASVTVTVNAIILAPVITGVSVTPTTAIVAAGDSRQFAASVLGSNNPSQFVTWSKSGPGSLSSTGLLTAPTASSDVQTITVIATSIADSTKSGSALVTVPAVVLPGIAPTVPSSRMLNIGPGKSTFDTTPQNADTSFYSRGRFATVDKDPDARLGYGMNFDTWLAELGTTLASATAVANGVVIDGEQVFITGSEVLFWVKAGIDPLLMTDLVDNSITVHFKGADGSEDDRTMQFNIINM